jgi:hypothetical protein
VAVCCVRTPATPTLVCLPCVDAQFKSGLAPPDLKTIPGFLKNLAFYVIGNTLGWIASRMAGPGGGWAATRAAAGLGPAGAHGGCAPALHLHLQSFLLEWPRPLPPGELVGCASLGKGGAAHAEKGVVVMLSLEWVLTLQSLGMFASCFSSIPCNAAAGFCSCVRCACWVVWLTAAPSPLPPTPPPPSLSLVLQAM